MNITNYRENATQFTILSFVFIFFILITSIIILFLRAEEAINLSFIAYLYKTESLLIILSALVIIVPAGVFFIMRSYVNLISSNQHALEDEHQKTLQTTGFISKLIEENFTIEYAAEKNDKLGQSLMNLRDTLKNNKEAADKRRKEDDIRNWNAEGLAKFGDILRKDNDNIHNLAYNVIRNLTDYIDGIQGGFYLLQRDNKGDKYFELTAFYAYGRKKFADNKIKWGKGIIGTAAVEMKSILITDLPDSYVTVTSGLGQANPQCILVSPMIANEELFGVFEVASLQTLEEYQIKFVEQVAESTASILSTVKMNMQTTRLLEESKAQAQTLSAQEEEMRQNMEELQATQEEAARQAERFMKLETTVNHTMIRAEYDVNGTLLYANTKFLKKLEYESNADVEGKPISMFISKKDTEWFNRIWQGLASGGRHFEGYMKHMTRTGKDLWTMATYTCIRNDDGNVERVLFLGLDTTEQKKLSLHLEGVVDAVDRASIKIVFDINGNIKEYNESFQYLFKYSEKEISKLAIFDLIDTLELELFNKKWENVVTGMNFQGQFKVKTKDEEERWIRGAFSAIYDMYGEVEKVIYIGTDMTHEKLMEIESKKQNETLKQKEKLLRESEKLLSRKLKEAKLEIKQQYNQSEKIKIRNEKILEGALDAIITTSNENVILFYNSAAVDLFGYSKEEVMEKNVGMLFDKNTIEKDEFLSKYVGAGNNKITGMRRKVKIKRKDGKEIAVMILLSKAEVEKQITYTAFIQTNDIQNV